MKILGVNSAILKDTNKQSQVDHWRIHRPLQELKKHVDWQIDEVPSYIVGIEKYQNLEQFTEEEMQKAFEKVCEYDIVFSSYHPDPTAYTMLKVARDKAGTQFVMDVDDDMFAINPDNPFWMKMDDEKVYWMQRMIADNDWLTTPSPILAKRFKQRRKGLSDDSVEVIPNYISDRYPPGNPQNDNLVIGYFGGSSHYADLHESGAIDAIQKLMHENKSLRFKSVGMIIDTYTPKARTEFDGGKRGDKWTSEVFPNLNMDIAIGPLLDNIFNQGKSNIKWQESTRAGACFIASRIGPYRTLNYKTAITVENTPEAWYKALKKLVDNEQARKDLLKNAQEHLESWRLENNWIKYKEFFERVYESRSRVNNLQPAEISTAKP